MKNLLNQFGISHITVSTNSFNIFQFGLLEFIDFELRKIDHYYYIYLLKNFILEWKKFN